MVHSQGRIPLAVKLEQKLRQRIVEGEYRPNAYLPSERQLAKDFSTSRVTIGKALRSLEQDGLVQRTPGRGTRVMPALERLSHSQIGIIHGELPDMEEVARQDSLRTLQGVRDTLENLGYKYEFFSVPRSHSIPADQFLARFGAMVFIEGSHGDQDQLVEFERQGVPVVVAKLEGEVEVSATWADHQEPMRQAVQTFVNLGHKRIAFVGREETYGMHGKAREGYLAGLREAKIPVDDELITVCDKTNALAAYFATKSLLRSSDPPTAIVAARDSIAEGICSAIEEAGMVVGHQVSVIGFDDTTWPEGKEVLTTFREECYAMGAAAAEMLIERIVNGPLPVEKRKFESPFILRRTAGPCFLAGELTETTGSAYNKI